MCVSLKATKAYDFAVPHNIWVTLGANKEHMVEDLHLEFVPLGKEKCIVKEKGTTVAVLLAGHRLVQVCGFSPLDSSEKSKNIKEHEGRPLYEWAVVQRHSKHGTITPKFEIKTKSDGTFVIKKEKGIYIVKTTAPKEVVALIEKQPHETWRVRCCPGMDPAMMACMTVCLDKMQDLFETGIRNSHQDISNQRGGGPYFM